MRLINATKVVNDFKIEFDTRLHGENEEHEESYLGDDAKPKYAILSHTWGWQDEKTDKWAHKVDEVTYNERHNFSNPFENSLHPDKQNAYRKIYYTCRRALDLGYNYVWIDSCCIDKSNSAELTESINSMFRWYSEADVCLVYLVDSSSETIDSNNGNAYPRRRFAWNSIGTLQDEGPRNLNELGNEISEITKVDPEALLGRVPLWEYSVEAKMSWASSRKSGRPEDIAYSLLGIFGLYMPLIYGEGARAAFQRLQLEIIKSTPDLSLFAWHTGQPHLEGQFCGILADSPSQFKFNRRICRSIPGSHHTMTNKGIQMTAVLRLVPTDKNSRFFLCLGYQGEHSKAVGIFLRKIGYNVFQRAEESITEIEDLDKHPSTHRSTIYITTSPQQHDPERPRLDDGSIHVPSEYAVFDLLPEASWDCESRILLGSMPCSDGIRALKLAIQKSNGPPVMVGLVFRSSNIIAFDCGRYVEISERLFTRTHRRSSMNWDELLSKIPNLRSFSNQVNIPNVVNLRAEVTDNARDPLETANQARADMEVSTRVKSWGGSRRTKMHSSSRRTVEIRK
ncbi:heterokaryon incompatibility protein-domain-containing protein [Ustulina deusta]|nr:heterokaryon incompatibility protein-domain-containing protein [Ustulina deusta]